MGQSLVANYLHLVWATKYRRPLIHTEVEYKLHGFINHRCKEYDSPLLAINSMPDHIHVLVRLSKNIALAKLLMNVKKDSSAWMKKEGVSDFAWQNGYGAFSVNSYGIPNVMKYIHNQKIHHLKHDPDAEISTLMIENNIIDFDPKFFWD